MYVSCEWNGTHLAQPETGSSPRNQPFQCSPCRQIILQNYILTSGLSWMGRVPFLSPVMILSVGFTNLCGKLMKILLGIITLNLSFPKITLILCLQNVYGSWMRNF